MTDTRDEPEQAFLARESNLSSGELYPQTFPAGDLSVPDPIRKPRLRRTFPWLEIALWFALLLPTMAAGAYYAVIASDRYVSEARFVVRTAAKPLGAGGLSAVLQLAGLSRADDDVYSIQNFLVSREALDKLSKLVDLRTIYGQPSADFLMRYPSLIYGKTDEEFFHYLKSVIDVDYNQTTGITTLTVQAFRPNDAIQVATRLLDLAEEKVNALNLRIRDDAVRVASDEVKLSEDRLADTQNKISDFRVRELVVDPTKNSGVLIDLIEMLGTDLATTESKLAALAGDAPQAPGLPVLSERASALKSQIGSERAQIHSDTDGLAKQLEEFERLALDETFASDALTRALKGLDSARLEANRQQLFLQRVVSPNLPDYAIEPLRLWRFSTVAALNLLLIMIVWLFRTGFREHAQGM